MDASLQLHLQTPSKFPAFPYSSPYPIQTDLMRHLYASIESGQVTIVESPTGTGKTLSLLCASLTWLSDDRERARKGKLKEMAIRGDLDAKDWVAQQTLARLRRDLEADDKDFQDRLAAAKKREEAWKRARVGRTIKRPRILVDEPLNDEDEAQFLPETDQCGMDGSGEIHMSPALRALMARVDKGSKPTKYLDDADDVACTKIFYASRTHSQLSQVLPELSKLKLNDMPISLTNYHPPELQAASLKRPLEEDVTKAGVQTTRAVSLGSRKHLCINDQLRLKSRDLDEACRERLGEKEDRRCPYLPPPEDQERLLNFRDQILAFPKDIEDLASAGRHFNTCPYFASRGAIPRAELVILPYNLLLQKSAREALGIKLESNIVIIDEAHNLIPTLLSLSTVYLTSPNLLLSFQQVCAYVSHFKTRLSPANLLHLKRLVVFLDSLKAYTARWKDEKTNTNDSRPEVMTVNELISRLGKKVAGINLLEVEAYLKRSKIARKIASYFDKHGDDQSVRDQLRKGLLPPLHFVEDFVIALMNTNDDGRVTFKLCNPPGQESVIEMRYYLLNPSPPFRDIVDEARSVVLAGGTMSPVSDVINQLFSYLPQEKITTFSCGHIIPGENLRALVVGRGPNGDNLEFKSDKQTDPATVSKIGQVLLNFVKIISAGMIVFFPSYKFLRFSREVWTKDGTLDKLIAKKQLFFEPVDGSSIEKVLEQYAMAATKPVENKNGALLFAVIGAKLSEGLNFSDDLARGVVVIGLPFANLGSSELQERLQYVKRLEEQQCGKKEQGQKDAAAELYENMCMNAVNQSIGRAIRHKSDWASLILLDVRYSTPSIKKKLPNWIGENLLITDNFGQAVKELGSFFRTRRQLLVSSP